MAGFLPFLTLETYTETVPLKVTKQSKRISGPPKRFLSAVFFILLALLSSKLQIRAGEAERKVAKVLEAQCLECHGGKHTRAGFDLSTQESLQKGGESGETSIVAGKPAESLLYRKITHSSEPGMPYKRPKLSDDEIKLIADWISAGAKYDTPLDKVGIEKTAHWSLKRMRSPEIPKTRNKSWIKNPIDSFILATLESKKFKPSAPAEKQTLLRRVTFDLTGLAPTPEEMRNFLADKSPDAYTKVVNRLLASPRYGERWARHWLDVVHYADSHGHDQDRPRPNAWPYRDYVIKSFNDDKPYKRFVEDQLAGDVLHPEDPDGIAATGFIVAGQWDLSSLMAIMEDTVDKKIARYLDRDDMVMTTMSTFVSSTVHCARCHNHKFDPISQAEYYNLQSVFAGVDRADRPYDLDPKTNALRQALLRKKTALEVKDSRFFASLLEQETQDKVAAWEKTVAGEGIWTVLNPVSFTTASGATFAEQTDHSLLVSGESPKTDTYTITADTDVEGISAVRLEVLTDASHPRNGPGRQPENGNFHLSEFQMFVGTPDSTNVNRVPLQNASADFNQDAWGIDKALDGDTNTAWGIFPETGKPHYAVFELKENLKALGRTTLTFKLEQLHGREHTILRPRLSVTRAARPVRAEALPENIKRLLALPADKRSDEQKIELAAFVVKREVEKQLAALPKPQLVYAAANDFAPQLNFLPSRTPRPVHVLKRGDVTKPGDEGVPGALSCVPGIDPLFKLSNPADEGSRRAALAKWITDPENTLTWRSIVNRVWHYHFGRGIVDTPGDFGEMGSRPTHPELLDWLAIWFRDHDGSFKELHRLIVTSAAYQQSSVDNSEYSRTDSGNQYLWRMNRTRLDAESIRDTVLQIAGKLDRTMGGAPVKQFYMEDPSPLNTPIVDYNRFDVDSPESHRRSIYRFLFRSLPDPFMDTLDCADSSQLTPVRNVSMTALQALSMWNNAFILKQCENLAERAKGSKSNLSDQIEYVFELALNRKPTRSELREMKTFAAQHGLANTCRVILNSNEFVFIN